MLDEVAEWVKVFDEVNVATALHRLAKLQPPGTAGPQSPVLRSASFQLLVDACQRLVPRFEAQAVSNTLWGAPSLLLFVWTTGGSETPVHTVFIYLPRMRCWKPGLCGCMCCQVAVSMFVLAAYALLWLCLSGCAGLCAQKLRNADHVFLRESDCRQ